MKKTFQIVSAALLLFITGCKKYLDAPTDKSLVVAGSISDLQALMDRETVMNTLSPIIGESSSDNYFLKDADFNSFDAQSRNVYLWDSAVYYGSVPNEWSNCYNPVYYANIALETLPSLSRTEGNKADWDNVKGSALFFRAKSFLEAAWLWAKAYDGATASAEPGVPIPLTSDFNVRQTRASMEQTYGQVISDLKAAIPLLPQTPVHVMRPSRTAAYGMLARTYLSMRQYDSCYRYANLALGAYNTLVDYNTLSASTTYPLGRFGPEVIYHNSINYTYALLSNVYAKVDTLLYRSYESDDLRKTIYYRASGGDFYYRGSYARVLLFNGIATDELYLMRAECLARKGDKGGALADLNTLLVKRWKTGKFTALTEASVPDVLGRVLAERTKELVFRGLRWMDIKRLNKEGAGIVLRRKIVGKDYILNANDNRYIFPIPPDIIAISGMAQNPR